MKKTKLYMQSLLSYRFKCGWYAYLEMLTTHLYLVFIAASSLSLFFFFNMGDKLSEHLAAEGHLVSMESNYGLMWKFRKRASHLTELLGVCFAKGSTYWDNSVQPVFAYLCKLEAAIVPFWCFFPIILW